MSIRKALAFSFIDRYSSLVIGVGSSMVLARLLTPADIGVFSITVVLLSFVTTFRDFGAGQYLVQETDLTQDRIRAVWTLQLGIGLALALLTWLASGPVSTFYNEPRMKPIMWLLALSYLINPFGSLTYAWLMRQMRYDALAVMRFAHALVGAGVSLVMAWAGHGPISLAWGSLAAICANALASMLFRPKGFPLLPGRAELRRVFSFGSRLTTSSVIDTLTVGMPELVLGKLQNMTAVGLFSRGNGLVVMFHRLVVDAVNSVALSMFAKVKRESGSFAPAFLRANAYVTALAWSFAILLLCLTQPLIRLLYGTQWDDAVGITRWLAAALGVVSSASLCLQALMAAGAAGALLRATATASAITVVMGTTGAVYGLNGLGMGLFMASWLAAAVWLRIAQRELSFAWRDYWRGVGRSLVVAASAGVAPLAVLLVQGPVPASAALALAIAVPGAAAGFLAAAWAVHHPISDEFRGLASRFKRGG